MAYDTTKRRESKIDFDPENYPPWLEIVDFCLKHYDGLNDWQARFIDRREKWNRWIDGGPTTKMWKKLVEAYLAVGGKPIGYVPTDDELRAAVSRILKGE